jgi:hypothetical protein
MLLIRASSRIRTEEEVVKRKHILRWIVAGGIWAASAACLSPPVESPQTKVIQQTPIRVPQNEQNQVDILFLVDNSPSMDAMQTELKNKFGEFFTVFEQLAMAGTYADLNIGVVTSDYGAGAVDNLSGGCQKSPGGQRGLLQTTAAAGTPEAMAGCMGPQGANFIHYAFNPGGGATANLPGGATDAASLVSTFTCMASVGSGGCGFEHQLESVYAALKNNNENKGFLRPGALLTVVFVTNEDDGSGPPTTDVFNPDPAKAAPPPAGYGAIDTYRQTDQGVACMINGALALTPYADSGGPLSGCIGAPNVMGGSPMLGGEYDVSRYINLFTLATGQGGVKDDPLNNVILVGIDAPEQPVQIVQILMGTGNGKGAYPNPAAYQPCPAPNTVDGKTCLVRLQHSCQNTVQPGFFGDPAVRLNTVINKAQFKNITSICGTDLTQTPDYTAALQAVGNLISSAIKPGCIPAKLAMPIDCVVEDVTSLSDGTVTEKQLPQCSLDNSGNPLSSNTFPCWAVQHKDKCVGTAPGDSPDGVGITVFRNNIPPPANTSARVECATVAG